MGCVEQALQAQVKLKNKYERVIRFTGDCELQRQSRRSSKEVDCASIKQIKRADGATKREVSHLSLAYWAHMQEK